MSRRRGYTTESVQRALAHHELAGVLHSVSPPGQGQPKFRVAFDQGDPPIEMTVREAYVLSLGLAAAERRHRS